jgi:hypothetical protein
MVWGNAENGFVLKLSLLVLEYELVGLEYEWRRLAADAGNKKARGPLAMAPGSGRVNFEAMRALD